MAHIGPDGPLGDGHEITCSQFVLADRAALDRLINVADVTVRPGVITVVALAADPPTRA